MAPIKQLTAGRNFNAIPLQTVAASHGRSQLVKSLNVGCASEAAADGRVPLRPMRFGCYAKKKKKKESPLPVVVDFSFELFPPASRNNFAVTIGATFSQNKQLASVRSRFFDCGTSVQSRPLSTHLNT